MIEHTSDEYRAAVSCALTGATDEVVFNGTIDHATVVIEEAFKAAKSHIRILSNKLSPGCYGSSAVVDAARAFLSQPEARLDVLIEDPAAGAATQDFLREVHAAGGSRVRVLAVSPEIVPTYSFNFMTVDDTAYRFEQDRAKPIAIVAGGPTHQAVVRNLSGIFDRLFASSTSAPLTLVGAQA